MKLALLLQNTGQPPILQLNATYCNERNVPGILDFTNERGFSAKTSVKWLPFGTEGWGFKSLRVYSLKTMFFFIAEAVFCYLSMVGSAAFSRKAQNGKYRFGKETLPCHDTSTLFRSTASTERAGKR